MIVGLTGGIGSGKTVVSKLFELLGCKIYNSDDRAKELYFIPSVKSQVIALLGAEVYTSDTEINKVIISQKIFSDTTLLHQLNDIIHPAVKLDFKRFCEINLNSIIIKETALLFETGIYKEVDKSVLVAAPHDLKVERVMKRNHITQSEVEKRMLAQWSDEQKQPLSSFIINNDGSQALIPQAIAIVEELKLHFNKA